MKNRMFLVTKGFTTVPDNAKPTSHLVESALILPTSNLERFPRDLESYRTLYLRNEHRQSDDAEQEPVHKWGRPFSSLDRKGPRQPPTSRRQFARAAPILNAECNTRLCEQLRRIVAQEERREL